MPMRYPRIQQVTAHGNPNFFIRRAAEPYCGITSIFAPYTGPVNTPEAKRRADRVMDEFISAMVEGRPFQPKSEDE